MSHRALLYLALGVFAGSAFGCEPNNAPSPIKKGQQAKLEFNLANETLWWDDDLKKRSAVDFLGMRTAALDAIVDVKIVKGDTTVVLPCELISIVQYDAKREGGYVFLSSIPADADTCCDWALKLSSTLGMPNERLKAWCIADIPPEPCLQNGRSGKWYHSIEILTSFNKEKPWRVVYTASLRREPEDKKQR